ncbi:MAG TPA: penicillin-binding transpeptidase domain-containing protein [Pyrinomonadaceae bacterium]
MSLTLLLQAAADTANNPSTSAALEKRPALLSLVYMGGLTLLILWLIVALIRFRRQRSALAAVAPADLPEEVRERLGTTSTNRGLRVLRLLFIVLALTVFGFHVYWARFAAQTNEPFQYALQRRDARNRRLTDSVLRGWILDRTGELKNALARFRVENGKIVRDYPMDTQFAHLFGTDLGDAGLERSLFGLQSGEVPEALQVVMGQTIQQKATKDIQLTIHHEMQQAIVDELNSIKDRTGKVMKPTPPAAVVILNPQTGEVVGMYSNPTFSIKEAQNRTRWNQLNEDKNKPLLNRTLHQFYIPGSTFKTFMMIAAHRAGIQDTEFVCSGTGYLAMPGAKPIFDDGGAKEVHGVIGIDRAYEVSCNQYFAQMAVKLGPERIRETAKLLGIGAYENPADTTRGRRLPDIWNASSDAVKKALAPTEATMVAGKLDQNFTKFDLALEGYGQGYAGQMTPFQMALLVAAIGNMDGNLMKPRIEMGRPDEVYSPVLSPQVAQRLREIMGLVTGGPEGTARSRFLEVKAAGINTGGKTGTAQKILPLLDRNGNVVTRVVYDRDPKGNVIGQRTETVLDIDHPRIDSWFLCIAPLERPQIAMAVLVEGGGYGGTTAAPIAARLVLKAKALGLLGGEPKKPAAPPPNKPRQGARQPAARR